MAGTSGGYRPGTWQTILTDLAAHKPCVPGQETSSMSPWDFLWRAGTVTSASKGCITIYTKISWQLWQPKFRPSPVKD